MHMLNTLIPNLITLILVVRKNLFAAVMATLMILSVIIAYSARGNISTWLESNPTPEQQTERISRGLVSDKKINDRLESDRAAINSDRLFIRQFNDSVDAQSKTVIPSMTVTYFTTAPGVAFPMDNMTAPRAYYSDFISAVWADTQHPKCVFQMRSEIKDSVYQARLTKAGVAILITCPISDLTGAPIGTIQASYLTDSKPRPSNAAIFQQLTTTSTTIAGYLAEVTAPEKDTWYRKLLN